MEDEKSEGVASGKSEEVTPDAKASTTTSPSAHKRIPAVWAIVTAVGVLAIAAATTFAMLWGATSADLQERDAALADATARVSAAEAKSSAAVDALAALERAAKYTACVQYYGGYYYGAGLDEWAFEGSKEACASESAWVFTIKPLP
jgi:hypothetical protein